MKRLSDTLLDRETKCSAAPVAMRVHTQRKTSMVDPDGRRAACIALVVRRAEYRGSKYPSRRVRTVISLSRVTPTLEDVPREARTDSAAGRLSACSLARPTTRLQ
eukprot:IDg21921t1